MAASHGRHYDYFSCYQLDPFVRGENAGVVHGVVFDVGEGPGFAAADSRHLAGRDDAGVQHGLELASGEPPGLGVAVGQGGQRIQTWLRLGSGHGSLA